MNEFITSGVVNLYALSSFFIKNIEEARHKLELYLIRNLGKKSTDEFLSLFDELTEFYLISDFNNQLITDNILVLIDKLKEKITFTEMVLVYLRLMELISDNMNEHVFELLHKIKVQIGIDDQLFNELLFFIDDRNKTDNFSSFLVISQTNKTGFDNFIEHKIKGKIIIYYNKTLDLVLAKNYDCDEVFIESRLFSTNSFQKIEIGDSINSKGIRPVNYSEIINFFSKNDSYKEICFAGHSIEYKFPNGNYGLREFDFNEKSGKMISIMGGSGTGKTTLLNLLNGTLTPTKGNILINGYDIAGHQKMLEGIIGYVPQEDMLFDDLTVYQNLFYSAKLSFAKFDDLTINKKIDNILSQLELSNIQHLRVGSYLNKSISGGQRKRLNIALELIREPDILLVDEPTSGLSSSDSEKIIQLLREQANKGKLIIANIHQPSSKIFRMFDSLWILDKGGFVIYKGSPLDAISYFKTKAFFINPEERECAECGSVNPEIIFNIIEDKKIEGTGKLSTERKTTPEEWHNQFKSETRLNINYQADKTEINKSYTKPNAFKQFTIFFKRNLSIKITNKSYIIVTLLQTPLLALLVAYFTSYSDSGGYTLENNKQLPIYIFMLVIVSLFSGMMASAEEIVRDRAVLKREKFLNLSWRSYLNSKITFLMIISAFQSLMLAIIGNTMLENSSMNMLYWITLFSASVTANLIGLNLSNSLNNAAAIYILIPVILIPQILLGGLIIEYDDLPAADSQTNNVPFIGNLSTSRWAFEAIAVGQYRYNDYNKIFYDNQFKYYNSLYYTNILLPELENRLTSKKSEAVADKIINNELQKIYIYYPELKSEIDRRNIINYKDKIDFLNQQFRHRKNSANNKNDSLIEFYQKKIGKDEFEKFKNQNSNNALNDLVRKSNDTHFFRDGGSNLVRLFAPVYKIPESNTGNAHFFAGDKIIFNQKIPTPGFNIIILWLQTLLLYLLLYFDKFISKFKKH